MNRRAERIHVVHVDGVYFPADMERLFHLKKSSLRREIRERRLNVCKRCGRYYILGSQILAWLRGGKLHRKETHTTTTNGIGQLVSHLS
jgi:hypothetical protein